MLDVDTFLTILYVMCDDFCKAHAGAEPAGAGRKTSLTRSEVLTLAIFSQWYLFRSERDFYRYASRHLRGAFPHLPDRGQYNRLVRHCRDSLSAFSLQLGEQLLARPTVYEILDTSGVPVRSVRRHGSAWLAGVANVGWCTRVGWFYGFRLLMAITPQGVITGFGFGEGSAKEQPLTDTFLQLRDQAPALLPSVGRPAAGGYIADAGFAGRRNQQRWREVYHAAVLSPPQSHAPSPGKAWLSWLRRIRQLIESCFDKLFNFFRLGDHRVHELSGFQANLAASIALHNFCIFLNRQLGRPALLFADLLEW
jgi:hypothetical protein